jgi:predicted kinase
MRAPGTLHLLVGPVGAGKSTFGRRRALELQAVFLDLDTTMVRLFGADPRPAQDVMSWYLERRERCRGLLWEVCLDVLAAGTDVFLEIGLLGAHERQEFYEQAQAHDVTLLVYVLDVPRDIRRARVMARNERPGPHTQVVPEAFFERASDAWEPPPDAERSKWRLLDVSA